MKWLIVLRATDPRERPVGLPVRDAKMARPVAVPGCRNCGQPRH